jgi:hypothetical protein
MDVIIQGLREGLQRCKLWLYNLLVATSHASSLQKKVSAIIIIVLILMVLGAIHPFIDDPKATTNNGLEVSVTVLPSARMQMKYQARQINISAKDIAQGYVDVRAASIFTVATARGTTYYLDVHSQSNIFSAVKIEGLGSQVLLGADGGAVTQSGLGLQSAANTLNYRFMLKDNLQPGTYDWPLQLGIRVH